MSGRVKLEHSKKITETLRSFVSSKKLAATVRWRCAKLDCERALLFLEALKRSLELKVNLTYEQAKPLCKSEAPTKPNKICIVFGPDELLCGGLLHTISRAWSMQSFAKTYVFGYQIGRYIEQDLSYNLSVTFQECLTFAQKLVTELEDDHTLTICTVRASNGEGLIEDPLPLLPSPLEKKYKAVLLAALFYWIIQDTQVQENLQRVLSTDQSVKNCDTLLHQLKRSLQKVRQETINREICEMFGARICSE